MNRFNASKIPNAMIALQSVM